VKCANRSRPAPPKPFSGPAGPLLEIEASLKLERKPGERLPRWAVGGKPPDNQAPARQTLRAGPGMPLLVQKVRGDLPRQHSSESRPWPAAHCRPAAEQGYDLLHCRLGRWATPPMSSPPGGTAILGPDHPSGGSTCIAGTPASRSRLPYWRWPSTPWGWPAVSMTGHQSRGFCHPELGQRRARHPLKSATDRLRKLLDDGLRRGG